MTPKLTQELHQALSQQHGQPLQVEDPVTNAKYMLIALEVYERLQQAVAYDASEPDPREFYPAFYRAVKDDIDAPGMEEYDTDPQDHQ